MEFTSVFLNLILVLGYAKSVESKSSMRQASKRAISVALHVTSQADASKNDMGIERVVSANSDNQEAAISPELEPKSDRTFFRKDYPYDKRPKADPFHFHHPYPAVQDSGDYDADFVKDENKDNGSWKAQETYDRLRSKLAKEKRDLAKAYEKKRKEDQELEDAMKRHQQEQKDKAEAKKKVEEVEKERERKRADKDKRKANPVPSDAPRKNAEGKDIDKGKAQPAGQHGEDIDEASTQTKEAVDRLDECKKKLEEARKKLKELMKELEEAKAAQDKANSALDRTAGKELAAEEKKNATTETVHDAYAEYLKSKEEYERQKAIVAKLEGEIKVAAARVEKMRDAEDKSGGVYPSHDERSSAVFPFTSAMLVVAIVELFASW